MDYAIRIKPGQRVKLRDLDADAQGPFSGKDDPKAQKELSQRLEALAELQQRLLAESEQALLVVLQAMDTAGKDGVLRHVVGPLDSRGVSVVSFKKPNDEEAAHDFLWRVHRWVPRKGQMVFFNRSHYEDVLVPRVNGTLSKQDCARRLEHINAFEAMLSDEGVRILKFYLHISKDEQKQRLQARLDNPEKHWKFDEHDLSVREQWDDYMDSYEQVLSRTSTETAPWYVIPSNRKWYRNLAMAHALEKTLEDMSPSYPVRPGFDPRKYHIE